jgi:hypothetical protein
MKWQIQVEVKLTGTPEDVEEMLDGVMGCLVDTCAEDPSIGVAVTTGATEIEFVVDGDSIEEAQLNASNLMGKAIPGIEIIAEQARKADLVSA